MPDTTTGVIQCPGHHLHGHDDLHGGCWAFTYNGFPHIHCTHGGCRGYLDDIEAKIANLLLSVSSAPNEEDKQ